MQEYFKYLEEAWNLWFPLTVQNKEYALFLVITTWLVTATFYSIRISFLKRGLKRSNTALSAAGEQVNQLTAQHQTAVLELEDARQQTSSFSQQLDQIQNEFSGLQQQLRDKLHHLIEWATTDEDTEADTGAALLQRLHQRIDRLQEELHNSRKDNTRLEAAMAVENAKNAEKDQELQNLQSRLDNQSLQMSKLEVELAEHKALQTQQQIQAQRIAELEAKLASQTATAATPVAKIETVAPVAPTLVTNQPAPVPETVKPVSEPSKSAELDDPVVVDVPKSSFKFNPFAKSAPSLKPEAKAEPEANKPAPVTAEPAPIPAPAIQAEKPKATVSDKPAKQAKSGGLFSNVMKKIGSLDEKFGASPTPAIEEDTSETSSAAAIETPAPVAKPSTPTAETDANSGLKRLGGLFKKRG